MRFSRIWLLIGAASLSLGVAACGGGSEPAGQSGGESAVTEKADYAAAAKRAVGAVPDAGNLLDVRTKEEWAAGHAAHATHLPLAEIEAGEVPPAFAKSEPLYIYCRTGRRAAVAVERLTRAGYTKVENIGGYEDWLAAGGAAADGG